VILVTGGTGFVGRALVPALVGAGHRVRLLSRRPGQPQSGVEIVAGDLLEPSSLAPALDGVSDVVHLAAALPGEQATADRIRTVNVDGSRNLARAAALAGVGRFIHGSSAGVYGDGEDAIARSETASPTPATVYERSKLEGEHAVTSELDVARTGWIILRPSGVHGPGRAATAAFFRQVARRRIWIHGPARVIVHPTDVVDVVSAILLVLARTDIAGEVFNVAGPEAMTYPQLIEAIAAKLGVRPVQIKAPGPPVRALATLIAAAASTTGRRSLRRVESLRRAMVNRSLDISKARTILGFQPVPFGASLDATIAWARAERLL